MRETPPIEIERHIARCRVILSVTAFVTVYVDPTRPVLGPWLGLTGGPFTLDPWALAVMLSHLAYSVAVQAVLGRRLVPAARIAHFSTWADVLFGACIALVTEGVNSPYYVFFAFAALAAGLRWGLRRALMVTSASVGLYLCTILVSRPESVSLYTMRPAYLAITGYLVGYLGEQRIRLESHVRELEAAAERERIARSLHDGYVQALAGINLRVESCRELLRRGEPDEAFAELTELRRGVLREQDDLRAYIRQLIDRESPRGELASDGEPRFAVQARFEGTLPMVEHVLQIMLEGARNVGRHARAKSATIATEASGDTVSITIVDDGVGFPAGADAPWSIASRATELGGTVHVGNGRGSGGHVRVELPEV